MTSAHTREPVMLGILPVAGCGTLGNGATLPAGIRSLMTMAAMAGVVSVGCARAPAEKDPAKPRPRVETPEQAAEVGLEPERWLPAGLYFREHFYNWKCPECRVPRWAVVLGPYEDGASATGAAQRLREAGLPVGYPWAVKAGEIGAVDSVEEGVLVVAGLFEPRAEADRLAQELADARVVELATNEVVAQRERSRTRGWIVQLEEGEAVPAYSESTVVRILNLDDQDGRGEESSLVTPHREGDDFDDRLRALDKALTEQPTACNVPGGSIHQELADPSLARPDAFAPVRCPDGQLAYVRFSRTRVMAVVWRDPEGGYRITQPTLIECDAPWLYEWTYDRGGRHERVATLSPPHCQP